MGCVPHGLNLYFYFLLPEIARKLTFKEPKCLAQTEGIVTSVKESFLGQLKIENLARDSCLDVVTFRVFDILFLGLTSLSPGPTLQ